MITTWVKDLIDKGCLLQMIPNNVLNSREKFIKDLYKYTNGFILSEKDRNKIAKFAININSDKVANEAEDSMMLYDLMITKTRYDSLKKYIASQIVKYNRKKSSDYTSSFNSISYNFYRSLFNKIDSIEKEYPLKKGEETL